MVSGKSNTPISRVKCIVNTCKYNSTGDRCTAEEIEVRERNAASVEETDCATFSSK